MTLRSLWGWFLIPVLMSGPAVAQGTVDLDDVSLSDLMDIKIESASKQIEPLSEAPVPMTVITKEMIQNAGVRTVHEAMIMFVPGYTDAEDRNELNFAPRGIYATSQQKVLIMINGHRLNSRSYLTAGPGYGIALHNIERIEVLRGSGSSLYGNVALGGVINLITKKGKDNDSVSVDVSAGDHGQQRVRFLTGSGTADTDVLAWGQYYKAAGEVHSLDGNEPFLSGRTGEIRIDGVNQPSSHDFGMVYKKKNWTLFGSSRRDSWVEPYGSNKPYDYESYRTFAEQGPGLSIDNKHFGAKYESESDSKWSWTVNPYYDRSEIKGILITPNPNVGAGQKQVQVINWIDDTVGFIAQGSRDYSTSSGSGTFLFGTQVDAFKVVDSLKLTGDTGTEYDTVDTKASPLLGLGGEEIYSAFVQNKHRFSNQWILNAGGRFDHKNRHTGENSARLSPRLALIYLPNATWEHKLSYSESFVDAPYWYRYTTLASFAGSEFLNPEVMRSAQYQAVWKVPESGLRNSATIYYQKGTDLIVNNPDSSASQKYLNSGSIESVGIENELSLKKTSYEIFWNLQYAQALNSSIYTSFGNRFAHVPNWTSNLIFNYLFSKDASANVTVQYVGDQVFNRNTFASPIESGVPAATTINIGGRYANLFKSDFYADVRFYNVLDAERFQGGQTGTQAPFRQAGRWMLATIGYSF